MGKEEPQKDEESKKEEDSKCEKIEGADGKTYYGTVASGFTSEQVVAGADKLLSLFGMVGSFLGPGMAKQVNDCKDDYKADIMRQLLPRCDDKCQPMKQCESSCKALKSKCVPSSLQAYFPMVKKGGSLRSMLPMIGLSESAPEMKVIDAWLEKLNKCKSEQLTSATVCLSKNYKGKMCNPDEPKTIEEPKEEKPKEENPKEEKQKIIPSKKCKTIRGVNKRNYVGTVAPGFTSEQVVAGADKLISLLGMTGSFLGAEVGAQITSCAADYKADIVRQLLPRCDDKCQPMKQCESSCKAL